MIFQDWDSIQKITDRYLDLAIETMAKGEEFYPHSLFFVSGLPGGQAGVNVVVPKTHLTTMPELDRFIANTRNNTPSQGNIEAVGFLISLPRAVASHLLDCGVTMFEGDRIAVLHVERRYRGVKTWVMKSPFGEGNWELVSKGVISSFSTCLPSWAYETVGTA